MLSTQAIKDVKPDSRMRIHLGELAKDIDGFKIYKGEDGKLILVPYIDVPVHELWVLKNIGSACGRSKLLQAI